MERTNPYVGPRAFQTGEQIYGRRRETNALVNLLMAERIVLLHSPSGAGKTSLIHASLVPRLKEEKFNVLPTIRVNLEPPKALLESSEFNRYIFSALNCLDELPEPQLAGETAIEQINLSDYLAKCAKPGDTFADLLIFDQFEEILSLDPVDQDAKHEFFEQLGEILSDRGVWALFAMREDYVAALEPYLLSIPTGFSSTFRLDLLGVESALLAIQEPTKQFDVTFTDPAAQKLLNDLRKVRVQLFEGESEERLGPFVEPLQLQVVCYRLWEELDENAISIEEDDLELVGDVNKVLASYYSESVTRIAQEISISERAIRQWFDRQLITDQLIRGQVLMGAKESGGLDNKAIMRLRDTHLVRGEKRRGATWYELTHDRLIEPIVKDNQDWYQENLSLLQLQTELWINHGRSEGLLLEEKDLAEAERWAAENELTSNEDEFLEACRRARDIANREKRNTRRIRILALVSSLLFVCACVGLFAAAYYSYTAIRNEQISQSRELAAFAMNNLSTDPELSVLLALEAVEVARSQSATVPHAEDALMQAFQAMHVRATFSNLEDDAYNNVVLLPDGSGVVATSLNGIARLWDLSTQNQLQVFDSGEFITKLAVSPDGSHLVTSDDLGMARIWEVATGQELMVFGQSSYNYSVAFSPTSGLMATSAFIAGAIVWEASTGNFLHWLDSENTYYSLDFNPVNANLAGGDIGGLVTLWNAESGEELFNVRHGENSVFKVAFNSSGTYLASGGEDGYAKIWDANTGEQLYELNHGSPVWALDFSPDGAFLATGSEDGTIILWDLSSREEILIVVNQSSVINLKFSPDGAWFATIGVDGVAILWDARSGEEIARLPNLDDVDLGFILYDLAFSPSQPYLATSGSAGVVRVWDISDPTSAIEELSSFPGKVGSITNMEFSPDGSSLAVSGTNGIVEVMDSTSGEKQVELTHGNTISSLVYDPSGSMLAIGGEDGIAFIRDTANGDVLQGWIHGASVRSLSFSPDSQKLVTAGEDGIAIAWEISSGEELFSVSQEDALFATAFSNDGKWLATAGADSAAHIWDAETGEEMAILEGHTNSIFRVLFHPTQPYIVTSSADGTVRFWNFDPENKSGQEILVFTGHRGGIEGMDFSPDGSQIVTAGWDGTVKLWDGSIGHTGQINEVQFSNLDGTRLATASDDGTAIIWDALTQKPIFTLLHDDAVNDLDFSPDGTLLATASNDGKAVVWDVATGKQLYSMDHQETPVLFIGFSPEGSRLATIEYGKKGRVWETATGKLLFEVEHTDNITGLDFSEDGTLVTTTGRDNTIKILDASTGAEIADIEDAHYYSSWIYSIDFSPDGKYLASSSSDSTAIIWDASSLEVIHELVHEDQVNLVSFTPDGKRLLTYEIGGKLSLWDPATGEKTFDLIGHTNSINWIAFNEDGTQLVSAGVDKTVIIWDLSNGEKLHTLNSPSEIKTVAFHPDGTLLAAGGTDNSLKIYPLQMDELITKARAAVTRDLIEEECEQYLHTQCE